MNDVTFMILKMVISVCMALVTICLIPYIKTLKEDKRYDQLISMVETVVKAAEQTWKSETGEYKKSEVLTYVAHWMEENGIKVTQEQLDQLIECAVYRMKQEK